MQRTPVTQIFKEQFTVLKEDRSLVFSVLGASVLIGLAVVVVMMPIGLIVAVLVGGAAGLSNGEDVSPLMIIAGVIGYLIMIACAVGIGFAANAFILSGLIGVLRVRKAGMHTSFSVFMAHAKAGFRTALRGLLPILIPIAVFVVCVILATGMNVLGTMGLERAVGEDAAIIFGMLGSFLMLPLLFVFTITMLLFQLVMRYALYQLFAHTQMKVGEAYKHAWHFVKGNFGAVLGLHGLFLLVMVGIAAAFQMVMLPFIFLMAIPIVGIIIGIPLMLVMSVASAGVQSAALVWMESSNLRLFHERGGEELSKPASMHPIV